VGLPQEGVTYFNIIVYRMNAKVSLKNKEVRMQIMKEKECAEAVSNVDVVFRLALLPYFCLRKVKKYLRETENQNWICQNLIQCQNCQNLCQNWIQSNKF